jgi:IPT/TIG domain-containing protein
MRRLLPLFFLLALMTAAFAQQRGASITAIAPTFGPPGTTVSIRGAGFVGFEQGLRWVREVATEPPPGVVEFNGVAGDILFWQDDLITVKVPKSASTGEVRVILPQSRVVLTGAIFDVYYSSPDETPASKSEAAQADRWRGADADRENESRERPFLFEKQTPPLPLYANPWFSSLSPGQRTFFAENGFSFGGPFTLGRGGLFTQRGIRPRSPFDRFGSGDLFPDFFFRSSRNFGVRPFGFFFDRNRPFQFRNEGHIFRR